MFNSRLQKGNRKETPYAHACRQEYCYFRAEHVGEKTSISQFLEFCKKRVKEGSFTAEKIPSKSVIEHTWFKLWDWDKSALEYIIHIIDEKLETADDKYEISILELIIEDVKFIKKLYSERDSLKKDDFDNIKDYFITINHIEDAISEIEKRIRMRLEMPTNYNANNHKVDANLQVENELENIKRITDVFR